MMVEQAKQIAEQANAEQFRLDGVTPDVTHSERVANVWLENLMLR